MNRQEVRELLNLLEAVVLDLTDNFPQQYYLDRIAEIREKWIERDREER